MTDFFSRIFSIPSDDSSAYSSDDYRADDDGGGGGGGGGGNNGSKHNAGSGGGRNAKRRKDKKKKKKEEKEGGGRNNKSRPSLPPPPQCATDGNDTITSSNGGTASSPASSRAASDLVLGRSARGGASSTGSDTETTGGPRPSEYPREDDDDDDDGEGDHGRDSDRRALRPNGGGSGGRGRRRRDDSRAPHGRSASEQPRGSSRKVGAVAVAATAGDKAHRPPPVQPQPVQTSPTRRHRSLSTTRKGGAPAHSGRHPAAAASSPRGDPALVPIHSWSSGGEDEDEEEEGGGEEDERAGLRGGRHRSSSSSAAVAAHERSSSSAAARRKRHRQQPTAKQQEDDRARPHSYGGTKTSSAAGNNGETTTTTTTTRQQHEKVNWLSRTFAGVGGGSKKNSPGSGGGGGGGATQSQHWSKRGTSKTRRPTPEILAVDEANEKATVATGRHGQKPRSASQRGADVWDRGAKLNLPSPGGGGGQQRKQPIHVGDSIVISHHEFLKDSMEMSVLTMPLEFVTIATTGGGTSANEEELRDVEPSTGGVPSKYENFAVNIQEVGRRTVLENAIVKAYYSNEHAGQDDVDVMETTTGVSSADGPDGPAYPRIGAYASRYLEDGTCNRNIYQSYSRDQSIVHDREDGIEVSPANRLGLATAPHAKLGVSQHHHGEEEGGKIDSRAPPAGAGKHQWPCDPSAEGYSLTLNGGGGSLSPPPPPPMPPPLPRRALPLDNVPGQSSRHQVATSCTTPAGGNSETVAAGHNDPPGLLSEPAAHPPDPPGDEFRPFDEGSSGLCSDGVMFDRRAAPKLAAQQPTGQDKLCFPSSKAVTFSLPPPKTTSSPALSLMGTDLDYNYSTNRALTFWSSYQLLPPIVEIWSSVECPNNMPGGIGCSALNWDEKKECELLGEEVPLHVSEEWIDIRDEKEGKEEAKTHAALTLMTTAPAPAPSAVAGSWEVGLKLKHRFHSIEDLPEDEYLEDILNCEEEDFSHKIKSSNDSDNDIDYRHRSTWNTAYKPPKLSSSSEDSVRVKEDNWNIMNRKKASAVIAIQRCVRGMLERQRLRSLLSSALIIQSFIRRYVSRRRYQTYLKLKQSYYPRRWKRRNMAALKSNVLT